MRRTRERRSAMTTNERKRKTLSNEFTKREQIQKKEKKEQEVKTLRGVISRSWRTTTRKLIANIALKKFL